MLDLGTVRPGSTIRVPFSSFDKDDGSSITMTNYAAADILVYKDGSTTERASTAGFTATTDFDGKTGKHLAIIDLSDNTTSGFWNAGSEYLVAIDAVTVDAVTTGGWIARFRIGYPNAILDTTIATLSSQTSFTLTTGPAENDALKDMWAIIHDIASSVQLAKVLISAYTGSTKTVTLAAGATFTVAAGDNISVMDLAPIQATTVGRTLDVSSGGEAGIDWANVGSPSTSVNLSATTTNLVNTVTTYTGNTPQTGDAYARIGAAGAGLTALGDTRIANLDTTVSSRGTSTLTQTQVTGGAYSIQSSSCVLGDARIANLDTTVSSRGTSTLTQTQVTGGAYTIQSSSCVLGDARIANLDAAVSTRGTSTLTQTQVTGGAYSIQSSSCVLGDARIGTINTNIGTPSNLGTGATVAANLFDISADASNANDNIGEPATTLTEAISNLSDTVDKISGVQAPGTGLVSSSGSTTAVVTGYPDTNYLSQVDNTYVGCIAVVYSGTGYGQARLITGYTFSAGSGTLTVTPAWTTNPGVNAVIAIIPQGYAYAAGIRAAVGMSSANLDTQLTAIDDYIDTEVAAIKAKTDNLPSDPADASDIAASFATVNTKLDAIDDYVDTEIAAIKAVTDQFTAAQSEPTSVPAANASPLAKLAWLAMLARNKITETATTQIVKADDGTTTVGTATVSDDGTTFTRGEFV